MFILSLHFHYIAMTTKQERSCDASVYAVCIYRDDKTVFLLCCIKKMKWSGSEPRYVILNNYKARQHILVKHSH